MTLPRGASRALYAGNGQATEFPFFFKVFEEDQLSVFVTSPAGVTSEAAGWSVELDDGGGTVSYLHDGSPLPSGWKLAIMRDMPFVQEVDLITGTRFDPEVIETALDVATAERQQLLERLGRAIVVDPTDEAGPEALRDAIFSASATAVDSAASAQASAAAAAGSAQGAAGSAAIATEQREAACACAQESRAARDAAIAQAEAANTLMEAEIAKVNAIVAANRTDQQAAVTAARQWSEKAADVPVEYDEEGNPRYSARHWADKAQKIALSPDGETVSVGAEGILKALGGNLQLNDEEWITHTSTWVAPAKGWYEVTIWHGGWGGWWSTTLNRGCGGFGVAPKTYLAHYEEGEEVAVSIAAGGLGTAAAGAFPEAVAGGVTTFGDLGGVHDRNASIIRTPFLHAGVTSSVTTYISGAGAGGANAASATAGAPVFYGAGGAVCHNTDTGASVSNGYQGAVRVRRHDPAKAAGPVAAPALFAARRMVARVADNPATVNLYDPATGQGSVWLAEEAEAKIAEGWLTQPAWEESCAARAAEEYEAWLAAPDTEAERFALLRDAREAKLAATDYLMAPDYPLSEDARKAVTAYRQALRDLPAQAGAPWDGGGEATPWPPLPAPETVAEAPCA